MTFSAKQIAEILHGEIEGNAEITVSRFAKIEEGKPGAISFLSNPKYTNHIYNTQSSIILVNKTFTAEKPLPTTLTLIRVENSYAALADLLTVINNLKPRKSGIETPVHISPTATYDSKQIYIGAFSYIGDNVSIGNKVSLYPHTYIGDNVTIGDDTIIYSGVKIYSDSIIGRRCIIHSGAVIGSDGFGFATEDEIFKKIPQLGNVIIEDDVEIGANTTIDRSVMDSTIIRRGVKLDNLIQVAHNVEIGENTGIAAQVGISGSTKIGSNCLIGGQAGLSGHINIGNNVHIGAQAGIMSNVEGGKTILGSPAMDAKGFFRSSIIFTKLPEMYKQLGQLQKRKEKGQ
ncbi:MAG: UDP-3-O-(3-hydroxymyristoyl)glucosamine N-acyltransferase [Dysgonamonadaceae bacterium]|jgi:UDP-3-O-[3-hydroxymyristoyl] glucosamine N-acyltransferase|nr:UDP-3-O-(3-hydroxymyristoyl)glucosamine N-acyltransferase [Dysgonamonadaceae bacterium]